DGVEQPDEVAEAALLLRVEALRDQDLGPELIGERRSVAQREQDDLRRGRERVDVRRLLNAPVGRLERALDQRDRRDRDQQETGREPDVAPVQGVWGGPRPPIV